MLGKHSKIWITLIASGCGIAFAVPPRFVNTDQIVLGYQSDPGVPIEQVRVWISRDMRRSWQPVHKVLSTPGSVRFSAQGDGRYDVYMVLVNAAGRSAEDPTPGARSHGVILVDTTPPLLQVHRAEPKTLAGSQRQLRFELTLVEEHLHEHGVRLFYRKSINADWRDGGAVLIDDGSGVWPIPADLDAPFEILLVTADRAGNRAMSEPFLVKPRSDVSQLALEEQIQAENIQSYASPKPVEKTSVASITAPFEPERLARLRERVKERLDRGQLSDAEALLSVALTESPTQPELLSDLGSVLYRMERFGDAAERYEAALAVKPEYRSALEGLALVAQTERRYPEARTHLQQLLTLSEDSALTWLRFGDVENRLGNRSAARKAWERSMELTEDAVLRSRAQQRLNQFPESDEAKVASHAQQRRQRSSDDRPLRGRALSEATRS